MKIGDIVKLIKPCDEHTHYINCYGIVIDLYSRCREDFIEVRMMQIRFSNINTCFHNTISCYQYRFTEKL